MMASAQVSTLLEFHDDKFGIPKKDSAPLKKDEDNNQNQDEWITKYDYWSENS